MNFNIKKIFHGYLDIDKYSDESKAMISSYFLLSGLMYGALQISAAFYVIYILDIIGFAKYGL